MAADTRETRTIEQQLGDLVGAVYADNSYEACERAICAAYLLGANESRKALEAAAKERQMYYNCPRDLHDRD